MNTRYTRRLFLTVVAIFALFTIGVILFENAQEKRMLREAHSDKLEAYADMLHAYSLDENLCDSTNLKQALALLPPHLRVTLIDSSGHVLFDNTLDTISGLSNHGLRPEIQEARTYGSGNALRISDSNGLEYLYYAKKFGNHYIRVALPHNPTTRGAFTSDNLFLYFVSALFIFMLVLVHRIANRYGRSIARLRDFATSSPQETVEDVQFPDDELGEVGRRIAENYRSLHIQRRELAQERERLLQHVQSSEEGICFFDSARKVEFFNGLFVRHLHTLSDETDVSPDTIFRNPLFTGAEIFLNEGKESYYEQLIHHQGKVFSLRVNRFEDRRFELVINDVTRLEKTRRIKQELTENIAHELRTPVTAIRGYLETLIGQPTLDGSQQAYFLNRAYERSLNLSALIDDISLIGKIETGASAFTRESIALEDILHEVQNDLSERMEAKHIRFGWDLPSRLSVQGNARLLYAIFSNLTDNAIRYAGEQVDIRLRLYHEDSSHYHFTFYDTGVGIPEEQHLNRLFERFYRVNEGRTRETGGTGLGLSIVKNAIAFHRGSITARNRKGGGLEFLFQLHK